MGRGAIVFLVVLFSTTVIAQTDDAAFLAWAKERMIALDEGGRAFRALDDGIARARLIGMGESVHETEPFFTFRVRLLQDLVRRHRTTALILESGLAEVMAADDYITGRTATIDFDAALPGYFGGLLEARQAMEWLRAWNAGEGRKHPVHVYGADLAGRAANMVPALDRLQQLAGGDPAAKALIDAIRPVAAQIGARYFKPAAENYAALSPERKAELAVNVSLLADRIRHTTLLKGDTGEWAKQLALIISEAETDLRLGLYSATIPRDHALSENALWVLRRIAPGERAVYWAHNAHVQRTPVKGGRDSGIPAGSFPGSGRRLDVVLGDAYYAIGTAYGGPSRFKESPAERGSIDGALEKVSATPFLLPLANESPAVESWLSEERPMRFQVGYLTLSVRHAFDAIAYFPSATAAARAGAVK
jgi:erythromycin esterase